MGEFTRTFRSRLNQLPLDLKVKLGEVSYQKGMMATSRKNKVKELLDEYGIQYLEVGTGTNRFIIKYDGYAIKIALDAEGVADNKQEWVVSEKLAPDVAKAYEISHGGHLLVASYCPAFTSYLEMYSHASTIRRILEKWFQNYLLGDVGLSKVNYANWGLSPDGRPVCIDYAYIFPAEMKLFQCVCGCKSLTNYDNSYTAYKCPQCGKKYEDRDIRSRISLKTRQSLFNSTEGIEMTEPVEEHEVNARYIKPDTNPDAPNPYEVAMTVAERIFSETGSYYSK